MQGGRRSRYHCSRKLNEFSHLLFQFICHIEKKAVTFNLMVALCSQSFVVLCSFVWTKLSHKSDAWHACCVRYCLESVGSPTLFYHLLDGCQQCYSVGNTSTRGDISSYPVTRGSTGCRLSAFVQISALFQF